MNGYTALKLHCGKYGMNDLRSAHVSMPWRGRVLLGTIASQAYHDGPPAGVRLVVRHFNGELWPVEYVTPGALTLIEREDS
jgi:hypothetical protein